MKLKVILPFDWAHAGVRVEHFPAGAEIETEDQDLIKVSTSEGWVEEVGNAAPAASPAALSEDQPVDPMPGDDKSAPAEVPAAPKRGRSAK